MVHRATRMGYHGLLVVNAFAFVATYPEDMHQAKAWGDDVTGDPDNLAWIAQAAKLAALPLCGRGNWAGERGNAVERVLRGNARVPLQVLGLTESGNPRHPRGVSLGTTPRVWLPDGERGYEAEAQEKGGRANS